MVASDPDKVAALMDKIQQHFDGEETINVVAASFATLSMILNAEGVSDANIDHFINGGCQAFNKEIQNARKQG